MKSCLQSRDTGPGKHSRISYSLHVTVNDWRELGTWPPCSASLLPCVWSWLQPIFHSFCWQRRDLLTGATTPSLSLPVAGRNLGEGDRGAGISIAPAHTQTPLHACPPSPGTVPTHFQLSRDNSDCLIAIHLTSAPHPFLAELPTAHP